MRVAFAGTPAFARVALERLHEAGHAIELVLTQPDRPAGRGMKHQVSPVKEWSVAQGIPVAQPRGLRPDGRYGEDAAEARAALQALQLDVVVVAAYGLILPAWVLALPRLGCLNIHASLLPRWRGAAPIHRAIEAGDTHTGVTIMQMDEGLDTGDMLLTQAVPIAPQATTGSLHDVLADLGARLIVQALALAGQGRLQPVPQPDEGVTYAAKVQKSEAAIDWHAPAATIERRLRAFDPAPGAATWAAGLAVKCWAGFVEPGEGDPGTILDIDDKGVRVACGDGTLRLTQLQRAGGRRLPAREFLAGLPGPARWAPGLVLGPAPA